jgi:hypothetical protein
MFSYTVKTFCGKHFFNTVLYAIKLAFLNALPVFCSVENFF